MWSASLRESATFRRRNTLATAFAPARRHSEAALATARQRFEEAAAVLGLSARERERLRIPSCESELSLMANGTRPFTSYRVQHNGARGPILSGLRLRSNSSFGEVRALAQSMTWTCALVNVPFGGGMCAIDCDPKSMAKAEVEAVVRAHVRQSLSVAGAFREVLSPGLGSSALQMDWIASEMEGEDFNALACATGKSHANNGLTGAENYTAFGASLIVRQACIDQKLNWPNVRVAIQGSGKVGMALARRLRELGCRIIALSNSTGGVFAANGLDVAAIAELGSLHPDANATAITNEELLALDCDVLVPAAVESVLDEANARAVCAKLVVEVAHLACTPEADRILGERRIPIVPDLLASAGGVIAAFLEWSQNLSREQYAESWIRAEIRDQIMRAYLRVRDQVGDGAMTMSQVAYAQAIERVVRVERLRMPV
jgi:glutamate dehydrogenase (NAD(P)+)